MNSITISQQVQPETSFASYISQLQEYIIPEYLSNSGELNWGRLICTWHQKKAPEVILTHTYAARVDGKEGLIFVDCSPSTIFKKCVAHLFTRPVHTVAKTIYNLTLLPFLYQASKIFDQGKSLEEKVKNIFKAAADIVLTPIYGLILTVATVATLILATFSTEYLYDGVKILGKLEDASNWGQASLWTLAVCFQPYKLQELHEYGTRRFDADTLYDDQSLVGIQLANFARAHIIHKIKNFDWFTCEKFPKNTVYQSSVLEFQTDS